jgi:hypothetical protein
VRLARAFPVLLAFVVISGIVTAQDSHKAASRTQSNGISVGAPKVFDNRTLVIMLESLSQSLQSMQSQFVDQKSIAATFGNIQGFRSTETSSNLSVSTLPIPGVTKETVKNTGLVDSAGNPLPDTATTTTTVTQPAVTPQPPALENTPAFSGFNPNYGASPSDLLSDEINLTYQIFNLRMLLERALSDRVYERSSRMQAVLGFNITIDPPRTANDAVAVVEISVKCATGNVSLVGLMPQEKTYNAAALSTKSNAFGGTAVVKVVQVGYSQRRKSQTFYLYRDNDTIAYERMTAEDPNTVVFGWMFRPVLGRRSVSPGFRQLFAILALPGHDNEADGDAEGGPRQLSTRVRTYWKKYDNNTLTSFEKQDANRATRFGYGMSLGLSKPELFESRYENRADYPDVTVQPSARYQQDLTPDVNQVSWIPVGPKTAHVTVWGHNFFTGTQIELGDKTYSGSGDGLVLKSSEALDLTTTLEALAAGPGAVIGRYGLGIPLAEKDGNQDKGISIQQSSIGPSLSGTRRLEVFLKPRDPSGDLTLADLPKDENGSTVSPLITVNSNLVSLPYWIDAAGGHVLLRAAIPDAFVAGGSGIVKVVWPLRSSRWMDVSHFSDPVGDYQVVRLSEKSMMLLSKSIAGFTKKPDNPASPLDASSCWQLFAGEKPLRLKTSKCTTGDPETEGSGDNAISVNLKSAIPDKIVLVSPIGAAFALDVPKTASDSAAKKSIAVNQYDAVWVEVALDDVTKVRSVEANETKLKFIAKEPSKPGEQPKAIKVEVTRELTSKPGNVDLLILDGAGKVITTTRMEISCTNCKVDGGK